MIDFFNLTNKNPNPIYYFNSGTWIKPRGISSVFITAIGAGGGGGGGGSQPAGTNKSGGGGGGSGAVSSAYFDAYLLPDVLKITVGVGGTGGTPQVSGTNGGATIIEPHNSNNAASTYILIANGGGGGGLGTITIRGAAGLAGVAATNTSALYSNLGVARFTSGYIGGIAGGAGGQVGQGRVYNSDGVLILGGGGGGSRNFVGGSITGGLDIPNSLQGSPGANGFFRLKLFGSTGGAGGTGSDTAPGGNGGSAAIGSGGGGGGSGTTGGTGGRGGDGLVIITCW
jgi:hypothetical protein